MSEAPETEAEQQPQSSVDRLADFIGARDEPLTAEQARELADAILTDFLRVQDAASIYAIPGVSPEGVAFVQAHWGPLLGQLTPEQARAVGYAWLETAETAEIEATMFAWLTRSPDGTPEGASRILQQFRIFRLEREGA